MTFTALHHRLGVVVGCVALASALAGCGTDTSDDVAATSPTPVDSPSPATPAASAAAPTTAAPVTTAPVGDGCPPNVDELYQRLKDTPAVLDVLHPSLSGLTEPTCAEGWAVAHTVVKDADSALVLFRYAPQTRQWTPVSAGTSDVCDAADVPTPIRARLGPAC